MLKARRLKGLLALALVFASLIVLPTTMFKTANAQGWLADWMYRRAVTINNTQNSNTLTDYQVLVVVDTASLIAQGKMRSDCGDIRFTDEDGVTQLNYWIESGCNTTSTRIWVRVPSIPGTSTKTIYMYYGNPAESSASSGSATFIFFDDFTTLSPNWVASYTELTSAVPNKASFTIDNGWLKMYGTDAGGHLYYNQGISVPSSGFAFETVAQLVSYPSNAVWFIFFVTSSTTNAEYFQDIRARTGAYSWNDHSWVISTPSGEAKYGSIGQGTYRISFAVSPSTQVLIVNGSNILTTSFSVAIPSPMYFILIHGIIDGYTIDCRFDWVAIRSFSYPEPTTTVSTTEEVPSTKVDLPNTSVIFRHMLIYSPNSTVFTHSFTATNTSTAGYETSYGGDAWAWRIYANPYTDPNTGATLENTASLVSNITITLPYATMLIEKLELYAKTNGTGNYRQLWVKILDNAGSTIAEVSNATMGINWALTTISVNRLLSNNVTIWINATVTSTTSVGEEICVSGVKLYMSYNTTTNTFAILARNYRHNVTTTFTVNLNTTLTNSSTIDLLVIDKLTYNSTNYPATPSYVGNETVNSNNYLVYRITGATSTGTYKVYSTIQNAITKITFKSRGVVVTRVLVSEPVTIEIPITGNIRIPALKLEYINTSSITVTFNETRTYIIVANATRSAEYILGYWLTEIVVDYGAFTANFNDVDGKPIDYETLDLTLVNKYTGESRSLKTKVSANLTGLKYGVHELTMSFKGIHVCYGTLDLYSSTNASTLNLTCTLKRVLDYRGLNRSLIFELGKQLVSIEDLSLKYPYSRSRVLLNGTGAFTLILDYYGKKPTSVSITGNVTITRWYWDGYYLVVTGTLGSVGEVNITDLYKLRVEVYDRLGNLIPFNVPLYINDTAYYTPIAEGLFYPETYNVTLPAEISGFKFYSFGNNHNETTMLINVSTGDVVLKAYYRVPSRAEVKAYKVSSLGEIIRRLLNLAENEEYVSVFFEGKLLDYYGNGVPGRTLTVRIYRAGTLLSEYNVTTDPTGYWRTPTMQLLRGETYTVSVHYAGDNTYVESGAVYEFTSESPPATPTITTPPLEILVLATGVLLLAGLGLAVIHAVRHVVVEARDEKRRFVRRKQP